MKILIVSATSYEIAPLFQYMDEHATKKSFFEYEYKGHTLYPLVTGVGALMTAFALARYKDMGETDVVINAGLAGAYHDSLALGEVVEVVKDRFADIGVEEADGSFTDVYQLGLTDKNQYPYEGGWIQAKPSKYTTDLKQASGLTVNTVHGTAESISKIKKKYLADVETMEGAGCMYACRVLDVAHHQIRAISNMVEPRNKDNWKIAKAIDELNALLITFVDRIVEQ